MKNVFRIALTAAALTLALIVTANADMVISPTGVATPIRIPLSGNTTFYVNAMGSAATCGTTGALTCGIGSSTPADPTNPATPFDTTQHAIDYIRKSIDAQGQAITINLAHGTSQNYGFNCLGQPLLGVITFSVVGDYSNPTAVTVQGADGNWAIQAADQCVPSLSSFQITDHGSSVGGVFAQQQGIIDLRSITFQAWNTNGVPVVAIDGGVVNLLGQDANSSITNTLAGDSYGQIFQAKFGGIVNFRSETVAVPSAFVIQPGFSMANGIGGYIKGITSGTFTGAGTSGTTGSRCNYRNTYSGGIDPNTVFIGNVNCTPVNNTF